MRKCCAGCHFACLPVEDDACDQAAEKALRRQRRDLSADRCRPPIQALDTMLNKVADFYEQEVDDAVDALSSLLEPLIMSILGILIGGLVVAMYLPIFKMGAAI